MRTTGPDATHRIACWNPPTADEASAGAPLRAVFIAAPPPAGSPHATGPYVLPAAPGNVEVRSEERAESAMPGSHGFPDSPGSGDGR